MLSTLVILLPVLAWRIQAQNGTISADINFTPIDLVEFGSSENQSEDVTTVTSSEFETTSPDILRTSQRGFQVNEASTLITVPRPQVATLLNDGSSEVGQTSFSELDVNGLSDISNENTSTDISNEIPELEDNRQNDSGEMKIPGQMNNPANCCSLGSRDEGSDEGSDEDSDEDSDEGSDEDSDEGSDERSNRNSRKKYSHSGDRSRFRDKREATSSTGFPDSLREKNSEDEIPVTDGINRMTNQPEITQVSIPEGVKNESTVLQAFSVGLLGQFHILSNGIPIQFQTIFFNEGQLYNTSSGKFIAEISGIYSFTYSAIFSVKPIRIVLIVNGAPFINNFEGLWRGNTNQASASLILRLRHGDEIWFEFVNSVKKGKQNIMFTFSGFLLSD
ncbi:otolin-1-like [Narcine bancroftii]|uniref:otolin-1-like n=1 Tax=Narcine bancroftii TaxID=1343680 RepID=UPI0038316D37